MKRAAFLFSLAALAALSVPSLVVRAQEDGVHAPSGGTQTTVISIAVPPLPNAPFTATVSTNWVRTLDDGSTVTIQNQRTIARDSNGRIFQERRNLYPAGDPNEKMIRQLEYSDPRTRVIYYCKPNERVCETHDYFPRTAPARVIPAGPLNGGAGFLTRTVLGNDNISGVDVIGTRETTTINAGVAGNDRAISIVKEFWFSPQLGINVIEKRQDPRIGTQTFTVSDISLGEPDARLFDMPSDYRVVDARRQNSPAGQNSGAN